LGRVHVMLWSVPQCPQAGEIDPTLLKATWSHFNNRSVAERGCVASFGAKDILSGRLPILNGGLQSADGSFSIELTFECSKQHADIALLRTRMNAPERSTGVVIETTRHGHIRLTIRDGKHTYRAKSDTGLLKPGTLNHAVFIVDAGPKIITCVLNGKLCDGGEHRQYGWLRYDTNLGDAHRVERLAVAPEVRARVSLVRIYNRYLLTSEAVGNYRACVFHRSDEIRSDAQQGKSSGRVKPRR
jgi:predicted amino acid-binding ACT domain protein